MKTPAYNGWKNYQTWNVALYLQNTEWIYRLAKQFMRDYTGRAPYADFIYSSSLWNGKTDDGIKWNGSKISYREMNELMKDL